MIGIVCSGGLFSGARADRGQFVEQVVARVCGISGGVFGSLPASAVTQLLDREQLSAAGALALSPRGYVLTDMIF